MQFSSNTLCWFESFTASSRTDTTGLHFRGRRMRLDQFAGSGSRRVGKSIHPSARSEKSEETV